MVPASWKAGVKIVRKVGLTKRKTRKVYNKKPLPVARKGFFHNSNEKFLFQSIAEGFGRRVLGELKVAQGVFLQCRISFHSA